MYSSSGKIIFYELVNFYLLDFYNVDYLSYSKLYIIIT